MNDTEPIVWSGRLDTTQTNLFRSTGILGALFSAELAVHFSGHFIETFYVGKSGPSHLSAITLSIVVLTFPLSFLIELGTGLTTLVAQSIGAKDTKAAGSTIAQAILLCAIVSFPLAVLGAVLAPYLLAIMGADSTVIAAGNGYLRLAFLALFVIALPFVLNAALRALGNAALATWLEVFQLAVLFILTPIFVVGLGPIPALHAFGAMIALVIARLLAGVLQLGFFISGRAAIRLTPASFRPDRSLLKRLVSLSLPPTAQQLTRHGADAIVVRLVAGFGTAAVAGFTLSLLFLRLLETLGSGIGNAAFTIVGQNLGAGKGSRALKGTWIAAGYSLAAIAIGIAVQSSFAPQLVAVFNAEPEVVRIGTTAIRIIAISYLFSAVTLVLTRAFHGAGDTLSPFILEILMLWGIQVPLALGLAIGIGWGTTGIWTAIAFANVIRAVLLLGWFRRRAPLQFSLVAHHSVS